MHIQEHTLRPTKAKTYRFTESEQREPGQHQLPPYPPWLRRQPVEPLKSDPPHPIRRQPGVTGVIIESAANSDSNSHPRSLQVSPITLNPGSLSGRTVRNRDCPCAGQCDPGNRLLIILGRVPAAGPTPGDLRSSKPGRETAGGLLGRARRATKQVERDALFRKRGDQINSGDTSHVLDALHPQRECESHAIDGTYVCVLDERSSFRIPPRRHYLLRIERYYIGQPIGPNHFRKRRSKFGGIKDINRTPKH
jgi:hypothetical protein